jgi:activating signal cointegrator 1
MKALSLTQPWATLVATGEKTIETRGWRTNYRGLVAVHAAKGFPRWAKDLIFQDYFKESLATHHYLENAQLPTGAIIGFVKIENCFSTAFIRQTQSDNEKELAFGDYSTGRWGWILTEPRTVKPVQCRGALGLWEVPKEVEAMLPLCHSI